MIDITALTAAQVLSIPLSEPERLFTGNVDKAKEEWRQLTGFWHPDRNNDAEVNDVCMHVNTLYDLAVSKLANDSWKIPGIFEFKTTNGLQFKLRYKKHRKFELGDVYIAEKLVAYVVDKANEDLYREAKRRLSSFKFANSKMKDEVLRYLPMISKEEVTQDSFIMLIEKTPDVFCLADVLRAAGGKLDPRHVAWITSALLNIACYFKYAGITHNDISTETVFVSPKHHSAVLLGGWWYSRPVSQKLIGLPARTIYDCDLALATNPIAEHALDIELIKLTGRELLGDPTGSALLREKSVPAPLLTWLRNVGTDKVFDEYKLWHDKVLKESFGPRKFVKLDINSDEVYS